MKEWEEECENYIEQIPIDKLRIYRKNQYEKEKEEKEDNYYFNFTKDELKCEYRNRKRISTYVPVIYSTRNLSSKGIQNLQYEVKGINPKCIVPDFLDLMKN